MANIADLVNEVNSDLLSKANAKALIQAAFEAVATKLRNGEEVRIPDFGTFSLVDRSARTGRNPITGEALEIQPTKAVKFKVARALKESVKI